jgi:hypothetical protein
VLYEYAIIGNCVVVVLSSNGGGSVRWGWEEGVVGWVGGSTIQQKTSCFITAVHAPFPTCHACTTFAQQGASPLAHGIPVTQRADATDPPIAKSNSYRFLGQ